MRKYYKRGGDTHVTKEGKVAKKGLWYNIAQKKKQNYPNPLVGEC